MKHTLLTVCILTALPLSASARTLTIGLDLSGSNPLLVHENFAAAAAKYVSDQIKVLEPKDVLRFKTFGARNDPQNQIEFEVEISRRQRADKMAADVANIINSLPHRNLAQSSTNLIAWMEFTPGFDCSDGGQVTVITDGYETSELVSAGWIEQGTLPQPDVDLTGCTVQFYGLGAGFPAMTVRGIRNAWRGWMEQAGAKFEAIVR